jgi:hypothetical protein
MTERTTRKEGKASLTPESTPKTPPAPQNLVPLTPPPAAPEPAKDKT